MIVTVRLPHNSPGKHQIEFFGQITGTHFVPRVTFGDFKMTVYFCENRHVTFDFVNDFVQFDVNIGATYNIDHYSHFRNTNEYIFECSEIDLFNTAKPKENVFE